MGTRQLDARARTTMDAQLSALAKAQDEFRNAVSVGLGEMRTAYEGVARESANEAKGRASEREAARRAIETSEMAREKLEQKLLQCEEALREAKGALVETREQAKDANQSYANEIKDLTSKLSQTLDEKKKNEETLKQHAQELKQQLIIMKTKVERGEEIHKEKEEKLAAQETVHKGKIEDFKEHVNALKMELQDSNAKTAAEHKVVEQREAELHEQRNELMKLDAKNVSLIAELDNTRAQCVQWQRDAELAKAEMKQAHAEAEAAKEERMKEEKHREVAENETAESRRKAQEGLALAAEEKEKRKLAEQALDQRENELKDIKHKAQMMEKDYKEMLAQEKAARAEVEENYETLKQDSVNLYNAYTSCNQQLEEYRISLESAHQEAASLHNALAKQKSEAARDALRTRSNRVMAPPSGFLSGGSPSPKNDNGRRTGVRIGEMDDIRSPPSFDH